MNQQAQLAISALWPTVVISIAALLVAWWPWNRSGQVAGGHWGGPFASGVGFITTFLILCQGWPGYPPGERWQWLLHIAVSATLIGLIVSTWKPAALLRLLSGAGVAVAAAALLRPLDGFNAMPWKIALGAAAMITFLALEPLAQRHSARSLALSLCIIFAGAAQVLVQVAFPRLALAASAISASMGVAFAVSLLTNRLSLANGTMHVISALLPAILAVGWFYNTDRKVGAVSFILIAAAPLPLWISELNTLRPKPMVAASLRLLVTTAIVATAVGLAAWQANTQ